MSNLTIEKIKMMSPGDRSRLYANALDKGTDEARQVVKWIEEAGLALL